MSTNKNRKQITSAPTSPALTEPFGRNPPPAARSSSSRFKHIAQAAERGELDFLFLAEGLQLREQRGKTHDLDVVGRPDTFAVLAALSSVTRNLGLIGTTGSGVGLDGRGSGDGG